MISIFMDYIEHFSFASSINNPNKPLISVHDTPSNHIYIYVYIYTVSICTLRSVDRLLALWHSQNHTSDNDSRVIPGYSGYIRVII